MNKNVVLVVVILLLLGALAAGMMTRSGSGAATAPVEVPGLDDPQQLVQLAQGHTLGDPDAPITILEFADFQCPGCMNFAGSAKPQIELAYVNEGLAKYVFYDFPITTIHPHAFLAARAGRCADDQGMFWEYHDALFRNQAAWSSAINPPVGAFEDYAATVGLDQDAFSSCLRSDRFADVVTANMRLGQELGVGGTPTVMINADGQTRLVDSSWPAIRAAMEAAGVTVGQSSDTTGGGP